MTTGHQVPDAARARADERFKVKEQRATDAKQVMQEVAAAKTAERAKTERLKSLRLAKEEADRAAALAAGPVVKKTTRAPRKTTASKAPVVKTPAAKK